MKRAIGLLNIVFILLFTAPTGCAKPTESAPVTPATDAVRQAAFANTAEVIETIFGETVAPSRMLYITEVGRALVYVDAGEDFLYCAQTDKLSGEVRHISINHNHVGLTQAQRQEAEAFATEWRRLFEAPEPLGDEIEALNDRLEDACTPVATELVARAYADGRTIVETMNGFTTSDSVIEPTVQVGISVRMSEGECYTVTVLWPQLTVETFSFYPLGWNSCINGYHDPAEAAQYAETEATCAPENAGY